MTDEDQGDRSVQTAVSALAGPAKRSSARPKPPGRRAREGASATPIEDDSPAPLARLFSWLDARLELLERQPATPAGDDAPSAAEQERQARTMSSLIRVYEKLLEIEARSAGDEPAGRRRRKGRGGDEGSHGNEAERRRRDLAQRIDRLRQQAAGGNADGAVE
jgi:hypothetical protein